MGCGYLLDVEAKKDLEQLGREMGHLLSLERAADELVGGACM